LYETICIIICVSSERQVGGLILATQVACGRVAEAVKMGLVSRVEKKSAHDIVYQTCCCSFDTACPLLDVSLAEESVQAKIRADVRCQSKLHSFGKASENNHNHSYGKAVQMILLLPKGLASPKIDLN